MKQKFLLWALSIALCLSAHLSFAAIGKYSFTEPFVQDADNPKTLRNALMELEQQYKVSILYDSELVANKFAGAIGGNVRTVEGALKSLLKDSGLDYKKASNNFYYIILKKPAQTVHKIDTLSQPILTQATMAPAAAIEGVVKTVNYASQAKVVSGKVTDASTQEPLPGVNVIIKGTLGGTITDAEGNFTITVPNEESILVFSYVGYLTQEIPVVNQNSIQIALQADVKSLSEVVVIGYGSQEKKDITGAVSVISSKEIEKMPVAGFDQALQGRAAGVYISSNSGAPGSDVTVRIRGTGTIGNNNPLFVIDGIPTGPEALNLFNPRDIESMVVLKDAAAATIYGSRAANGVILVTTKKGKAGETRVNIDAYYGLQTAWRLPKLLNVEQYATIVNEAYSNADRAIPFGQPDTLGQNHNWLDELFITSPIQNYNLSVSGGSEKSQFAISGSYFSQQGIMPNNNFDRISFRLNTTHQIKKRWHLGNNLLISHSNGNQIRTNEVSGVLANTVYKRPFDQIYEEDGRLAETATDPNPLAQAFRTDNRRKRLRLFGNVFAEYELAEWLTFRTNVGMDINYAKNKNYTPAFGATPNSLIEYIDQSYTPLWQNSVSFTKTIKEQHNISAVMSVDAQSSRYEYTTVKVDNFITDDPNNRYITAGQSVDIGHLDGKATEWSLLSFIGRINYDFLGKYLLSASFRRDGSSRFAKGNKWGNFPSFSAAWRISDESFMKSIPMISDLKVRGSWGQLGNQEVGDNYATYNTVTTGFQYAFGTGSQTYFDGLGIPTNGTAGAKLTSNKLLWETSTQTDVGLDVGLFKNRLLFTADYFSRETSNMLLDQPVSSLSAATTMSVNAGSIRNRGIELSLSYEKTEGDLTYNAGINFTKLENKLLYLNDAVDYILGPISGTQGVLLTRTSVGQQVGSFYGYVTDGIFQNKEEVESHAKQQIGTAAGDIRFKDLNEDGIIDAKDQTVIGNPIPEFLYGLNAGIAYKGFDLTVLIQGVAGNDVYNQLAMRSQNSTNLFNKFTPVMNRWTGEGTSNTEPRVHISDPNNNIRVSNRFVEDGSYVRLKNVQLGYSLPNSITHRLGLSQGRLYISGQNVFTLTRYSGFDPEMGPSTELIDGRGADLEIGADKGRYPQARVFLIGLNLGF